MTGIPFLVVFVVAIVLMIVLISKFKVHPFLAILLISLALGIIGDEAFCTFIRDGGGLLLGLGELGHRDADDGA